MRPVRSVLCLGLALGILASAGLAAGGATSTSSIREEWRFSCGGPPYSLDIFGEPAGAERGQTPEARALRHLLRHPGGIETLPRDGWRLAAERGRQVTFTGRRPWRKHGMFEVSFKRTRDGSYEYQGSSHWCSPSPRVDGHQVGSWELDPSKPQPTPDSTEIDVLVHGIYCSSGEPPLERIRKPLISYGTRRIVIATVEAPPDGGFQTCQGTEPSQFTFKLSEPVGNRLVSDGFQIPFEQQLDLR